MRFFALGYQASLCLSCVKRNYTKPLLYTTVLHTTLALEYSIARNHYNTSAQHTLFNLNITFHT